MANIAAGDPTLTTAGCSTRCRGRPPAEPIAPGTSPTPGRIFLRRTYRIVLDKQQPNRTLRSGADLSDNNYIIFVRGSAIMVEGAGLVDVIGAPGLPEREDHGHVADTLAKQLGFDARGRSAAAEPRSNPHRRTRPYASEAR